MSPTKHATHPLDSSITAVPAFIIKLWKLVEDPSCDHLISWRAAGTSFIIKNQVDFAKELLPHYFKHSNLASFIRQLNFYGFHKVASTEGRTLQHEKNETEFFHPFFIRQQKGLLCLIKRKAGKREGDAVTVPDFQDLLTDVKALQGKQDTVDSLLSEMKQENQLLWQEIAQLREKHAKQQRVVAKLIHFLATLVRPKSGALSIKRKAPLMIDVQMNSLSPLEHVMISKKLKKDICLATKISYRNASGKLNSINDKESIHDIISDTISTPSPSTSHTDFVVESPLGDVTVSGNMESSYDVGDALEPLALLEPLQTSEAALGLPEDRSSLDETENGGVIQSNVINSNITEPSTSLQPEIPTIDWNEQADEDTSVLLDKDQHHGGNHDVQLSGTNDQTKTVLNEHIQYTGHELDWLHEQLSHEKMNIGPSDILKLFSTDDDGFPDPLLRLRPLILQTWMTDSTTI